MTSRNGPASRATLPVRIVLVRRFHSRSPRPAGIIRSRHDNSVPVVGRGSSRMIDTHNLAKFVHLLSFAAFTGGSFAQQRFMAASRRPGQVPAVRDHQERQAAATVTRIELPAIFVSIITGLIMLQPLLQVGHLSIGWHVKLGIVALLAVLAHLEMFGARRIVRARSAGAPEAAIEAAKARHALLGGLVGLGIVCVVWTVVIYL